VVKKIALLPTLLTLGNGVCGFAAVAMASKIDRVATEEEMSLLFMLSGGLILLGMVFDALDGYAARYTKSASEFGGQLDSLCDAISFGLAPAFLLLKLCREHQNVVVLRAVAVIAALYMACAVLRLARFNLENSPDPNSHKRFRGLPSPGAAGCVASLAIFRSDLPPYTWAGLDSAMVQQFVLTWAPPGTLLLALLMVSRLSYPHLINQLRRRRRFDYVVQVVLAVFLMAFLKDLGLMLAFWFYALYAPVRYLLLRGAAGIRDAVLFPHGHGPHDPGPH
jgi:CDP-diacylglycerol--serine O-phosphatidyltransferase